VLEVAVLQGRGEELASEGGALFGHDALGDDAMGFEPGQCVLEEAHGALLCLVAQQRGVGEARCVIDGDGEVLPSGAALTALASGSTISIRLCGAVRAFS
jgi:hypothetical protein